MDATAVKTHESYVVDSEGWNALETVEACRLILRTLRSGAIEFETDIPTTDAAWPEDVAAAADYMRSIAARTGRTEEAGYAQTGVLRVSDETWSAFATFAPWAYDATVWDSDHRPIVYLADEGQSMTLQLERRQYDAIASAIGETRLVPQQKWRHILKERRKNQA